MRSLLNYFPTVAICLFHVTYLLQENRLDQKNMDVLYLFKTIWQRKWLLLLVGIATAALTYFLAGLIPPSYKSEAIVRAGIIESRAIDLERDNPYEQQFQVSSQFENMLNSFYLLNLNGEEGG